MKLAPELALLRAARACLAAALVLAATTHAQSTARAPGATTAVATSSFEDEFLLDPVFLRGRALAALDAALDAGLDAGLDELGPASLARAALGPPSDARTAWVAAQEPPRAQEASERVGPTTRC